MTGNKSGPAWLKIWKDTLDTLYMLETTTSAGRVIFALCDYLDYGKLPAPDQLDRREMKAFERIRRDADASIAAAEAMAKAGRKGAATRWKK